MKTQSITLQPAFHRGAKRLLLRFWYNAELMQLVRSMGGRYSATYGSWYVNYSDYNIKYLKEQLVAYQVIWASNEEKRPENPSIKNKRIASGASAYIRELNKTQQEDILIFEQYMRGQRYSKSTIDSYLNFVRSFLGFFKDKQPAYITLRDVHKYNFEVIIKNRYSVSYQRQFIGAIKLFFDYVTHCSFDTEELERPKKERRLPTVLSKEEIRSVLVCTKNLKHKAILSTIYSAGLRVGEVLKLRIGDLDPDRLQIHVRAAKGKKDRYVNMSQANLLIVKRYLHQYTPHLYLFEGPSHQPYSKSSVRNILKRACELGRD